VPTHRNTPLFIAHLNCIAGQNGGTEASSLLFAVNPTPRLPYPKSLPTPFFLFERFLFKTLAVADQASRLYAFLVTRKSANLFTRVWPLDAVQSKFDRFTLSHTEGKYFPTKSTLSSWKVFFILFYTSLNMFRPSLSPSSGALLSFMQPYVFGLLCILFLASLCWCFTTSLFHGQCSTVYN
jgi:hypothetical protein